MEVQAAYTEEEIMIAIEERAERLFEERREDLRKEIALEEFQDELEEKAREIASAKVESIRDDIRRELVYEKNEVEIVAIAEEISRARLEELEEKARIDTYVGEKQAETIDMLYEGSEILKALGAKNIEDLVTKFEEMRKKIVELEAKVAKSDKKWRTDATSQVA
jgi:hypothetical protein